LVSLSNEAGSDRVIEDILGDSLDTLVRPEKVIPKSRLPESATDTQFPERPLDEILKLANERDEVALF